MRFIDAWARRIFKLLRGNAGAGKSLQDRADHLGNGADGARVKPMYDAVKPTEELINRKIGLTIGGQKYTVRIVAQDDQSSPAGAVTAVNKLIQDGIKFLIPPMFYVTHLAIIQTTEEAKVLRMKAFGLSPNEVNTKTPYGFGTGSNLYNIEPCFDYLVKNYPQAKRVAIIMPDDPGMNTALDLNEKAIKNRRRCHRVLQNVQDREPSFHSASVFVNAAKLVSPLEAFAFRECAASIQQNLPARVVAPYTGDRRLRPFRRRRRRMPRPLLLRVRFKNPNRRCRLIFDG